MSKPKLSEDMWCYHCEHEWRTDDYHNETKCPECGKIPIYRQSSFSFFYSYTSKHPIKKQEL